MRRHLRRRRLLRQWDAGDPDEAFFYFETLDLYPECPLRRRRRHTRAATREVGQRVKRRRLRLWVKRWGVPEELAVRFIRDRKNCSCLMCRRHTRRPEGRRGREEDGA